MSKIDESRSQSYLCKTGRVNVCQSQRPWFEFFLCVVAAGYFSSMLWRVVNAEFGSVPAYAVAVGLIGGCSITAGILLRKAAIETREAEVVYRQWLADRKSIGDSFEVRTSWNTLYAWTFTLAGPLFILTIGWLLDILLVASAVGLILGALGGFLLQQTGTIYANSERLRFRLRDKYFSVSWDEIVSVEIHPHDLAVAFSSDETRIRIPGYPLWSGQQKHALRLFLEDQILSLNVPVQESKRVLWKNSKQLLKS